MLIVCKDTRGSRWFRIRKRDHACEIIGIAKRLDCNLIILESRGMSPFKELMLGSVSNKVAHHANCPVMVVR
ncbi:MAG: universal stress protein [Thaumarchaeota archaeon]|nr:universal stress protein [Nitrososphaerota archaeon]